MTPVTCRVKHAPEEGTYGDCVRACVATILNLQAEEVPHFYDDDCDGTEGMRRVKEWLAERGYVPFWTAYPAEYSLEDLMAYMEMQNPTVVYMLIGEVSTGGQHAVVCRGGKMVHNPAWYPQNVVRAGDAGNWVVMVIAVA